MTRLFVIQNIIQYGLYIVGLTAKFSFSISELLWFMWFMYTVRLPILWKLIYLFDFFQISKGVESCRLNGYFVQVQVKMNSMRSQFDSNKGNIKRGSLILRNSKIAIVWRVSIYSDQINTFIWFFLVNLISYILAMLNLKSRYLVWFNYTITMQPLYQKGKRMITSICHFNFK